MRLLDAHQDPVLEIDLALDMDAIARAEQARLAAALAVVTVTGAIPRRLGGDASRGELALDKRRARRVAHVLRQSLISWGGAERPATEEERVAGAQLVWELWSEDAGRVVSARIRYIATWAKLSGNLRFGKTAVTRLSQEVEWMDYALRD